MRCSVEPQAEDTERLILRLVACGIRAGWLLEHPHEIIACLGEHCDEPRDWILGRKRMPNDKAQPPHLSTASLRIRFAQTVFHRSSA